jgi:hypothetical protein
MDLTGISHTTLDSVSSRPFLDVVHDICDRVLEGAQATTNIPAIEENVDKQAVRADQHNSPLRLPTQ